MEDSTRGWTQLGLLFQNQGTFLDFQKREGGGLALSASRPPPPPSWVPAHEMVITTEYLPKKVNVKAD